MGVNKQTSILVPDGFVAQLFKRNNIKRVSIDKLQASGIVHRLNG
jgi:hypothetical protein